MKRFPGSPFFPSELKYNFPSDRSKLLLTIASGLYHFVGNYPSLSGLVVNDCYVIDHYLLLNYFSTGAYKRGMVIMGEENMETKKLSSYPYYSNSREMSENFPAFCLQPDPIKHIILQYDLREYPISFRGSVPEIFRDGIQKAPFADMVW